MEALEDSSPAGGIARDGEPIPHRFGRLIGQSRALVTALEALQRAAGSDEPLLIVGETGTGKEVAARALHAASGPEDRPFHVLDCHRWPHGFGALPDQGTVLLDEPFALGPSAAAAIAPWVGAGRLRWIASAQAAFHGREGQEELLDRFPRRVLLPPLRHRTEDLLWLTQELCRELDLAVALTRPALAELRRHLWPGNVRELRNVLIRAALQGALTGEAWRALLDPVEPCPSAAEEPLRQLTYSAARGRSLASFERRYFLAVLQEVQGDRLAAERRTGLSTPSLYRLLKKNRLCLKGLRNPPKA